MLELSQFESVVEELDELGLALFLVLQFLLVQTRLFQFRVWQRHLGELWRRNGDTSLH